MIMKAIAAAVLGSAMLVGSTMAASASPSIRIDVFEAGAPSATITIPLWVVKGASKLLPKVAATAMKEHVDLDQIISLAQDPKASGVLLDIEDHRAKDRVIISSIPDEPTPASK
jgi:flagellar motor component MotA